MRAIFIAGAIIMTAISSGDARSASGTLPVNVHAKLSVVFTPASASANCDDAPGTILAVVNVTGGNGKPVTLVPSGDITDFALSATTPPANVVIAPGGIVTAGSSCATIPAAGVTDLITVTATQN